MTLSLEAEIREWARRCRACWEFDLAQEMVKDEGMRLTALELRLYAQPPEAEPGSRPFLAAWEQLREIAERALPDAEGIRAEPEPFEAAVRLRPETGQQAEVMLLVRIVPTVPGQAGGRERARQIIDEAEGRLRALGLQHNAWAA